MAAAVWDDDPSDPLCEEAARTGVFVVRGGAPPQGLGAFLRPPTQWAQAAQARLAERRWASFQAACARVEREAEAIAATLDCTAFAQVRTFVESAHASLDTGALLCRPLPVGMVFAGVNVSDHSATLARLAAALSGGFGGGTASGRRSGDGDGGGVSHKHVVATLRGRECTSLDEILRAVLRGAHAAAQTVRELRSKRMSHTAFIDSDGMNARRKRRRVGAAALSATALDFPLEALVEHVRDERESGRMAQEARLVLLVEDFEALSREVFDDLVHVLSRRLDDLPVVLLLGLATHAEAFHAKLSPAAATRVRIEAFRLQPAVETLEAAFERIIVCAQCPFQLGPRTLRLLSELFERGYFSLHKFMQALRFALLDHVFEQPLSFALLAEPPVSPVRVAGTPAAAVNATAPDIDGGCFRIGVDDAAALRRVPSACRALRGIERLRDEAVVETAEEWLHGIQQARALHACALDLFCETARWVLGADLGGRRRRSWYVVLLEGGLAAHAEAAPLLRGLAARDVRDFPELLACWRAHLEAARAAGGAQLDEFVKRLEELVVLQSELAGAGVSATAEPPASLAPSSLPSPALVAAAPAVRRSTGASRKEQVHAVARSTALRWDTLRNSAVDFFVSLVETMVCAVWQRPLHELVTYNHATRLSRAFSAEPRAAIRRALRAPWFYLGVAPRPRSALISKSEDLAIAFRLYEESGRLINLYDWFQAFANVFRRERRRRSQAADPESKQRELLARFARVVRELELLGFVRGTNRKVDHVARAFLLVDVDEPEERPDLAVPGDGRSVNSAAP
jgi:origin recognition complex subunit 3